jgi:hypothetical protein
VDGVSVGKVTAYTFSNVTSVHTITAKFEHDCPSKKYVDVDISLWYHEGIDFVLWENLFKGITATTFEPDTPMTRAMLVTVLHRLAGAPSVSGSSTYSDAENGKWYSNGMIWASLNGIIQGSGGKFGPNDPVTREQLAAILYRYAQLKGYNVSSAADLSAFTDAGNVSPWVVDAMKWAVAGGILLYDVYRRRGACPDPSNRV